MISREISRGDIHYFFSEALLLSMVGYKTASVPKMTKALPTHPSNPGRTPTPIRTAVKAATTGSNKAATCRWYYNKNKERTRTKEDETMIKRSAAPA